MLNFLGDNYTFVIVTLGCCVLGLISGALSTFALLRRQSLLGDAVSHAALPGVALAFLLTGTKISLLFLCGAAFAGWLATLAVAGIVGCSRIKEDTALGLVLSVFFGFGLVLKTYIQNNVTNSNQAGLDRFLFGQAAAMLEEDVWTMVVLGFLALVLLILFWKQFKLVSFDPEFAASLGFPVKRIDVLLTSLLVLAIVIGLQTVGVVLMSAMVVAPAAAARQWTNRLGRMTLLSALFGAAAGAGGAVLSNDKSLPTGPTIVLAAAALVVVSLVLAPNRGLLWNRTR